MKITVIKVYININILIYHISLTVFLKIAYIEYVCMAWNKSCLFKLEKSRPVSALLCRLEIIHNKTVVHVHMARLNL